MWDVVIVGAGPAGATAALAALRHDPDAAVLLVDAQAFPRDKVCGDGVAPQALDVLAGLGVDVDALVAGTAPVTSLRLTSPGGVRAVRPFARAARVVPREQFDDRLLQAALRAGAQLQRRRVRTVEPVGDHVVVDGTLRARAVIGADGAESVVRRACGVRAAPAGTVAVAVRGYAPAGAWLADEQVLTMTRRDWPAYAWAFPIGDGRVNVGYGQLVGAVHPTRAQLTDRLARLLPDAGPGPLRGHRLPLSTGRPEVGRGRVLLAGDAASLINPLTGEGIYYAVLSGRLAGAAALSADPAGTYRATLRRALGPHLRQTDLLSRLAARPRLVDAVTAAAAADQRVFDALVEIGLARGRVTPGLLPATLRAAALAMRAAATRRAT